MLTERTLSQSNKLGRREEIANLISLVDAKDTPFSSMAKKGAQPQQTLFRWQVDALPDPKTDGFETDCNCLFTRKNPIFDLARLLWVIRG